MPIQTVQSVFGPSFNMPKQQKGNILVFQIILNQTNGLKQYYQLLKVVIFIFNFQLTTVIVMVVAAVVKPFTIIGFLLQYYLLIAFVFVKNLVYKLIKHPKSLADDFSYHPMNIVHPHVFAHTNDLIQHNEFTFQIYEAKTSDDAYVSLWRIRHIQPNKWNDQNPILIQHGLLDCSMSWFLHEQQKKSLPFVLAQAGYDVWVGNNRGTIYSDTNSHIQNYWNFNVDHFAEFDQPTLINKVLSETKKQRIIYIGHSQGSTQFLLGMSYHEQLQQKIQKFVAMGPVISLKHLKDHDLLKILSKYYLVEILQTLGFKTILNLPKWMNQKVGVLVYHYAFYANIILNFIYFLCGKTEKNNLDTKRLGILVSHEPGGTSIQSVKHWVQAYRNGKFRKYDYGKKKNKIIYGSDIPPQYKFDHIKEFPFKTHIFRGQKDAVISDTDFEFLIGHFDRNNLQIHAIKDYAHLDYAWSINAKQDIYDKIVEILKNQKNGSTKEISLNFQTEDTSFESRGQLLDFEI